jgi:hypothetical protein
MTTMTTKQWQENFRMMTEYGFRLYKNLFFPPIRVADSKKGGFLKMMMMKEQGHQLSRSQSFEDKGRRC